MTVLVFLVILCPVSFSYASIVFASAALSGLFLGSSDLFLIFPGDFLRFFRSLPWAFQVFSSHVVLFRELLHLYLALLRCRDDFFRLDSSPACSFARQGLFFPSGVIPSLLFCSAGMISFARIHPQPALFLHKDDFDQANASLQAESFRYGCNLHCKCIAPTKCIPANHPSGNVPLRKRAPPGAPKKSRKQKMLPG